MRAAVRASATRGSRTSIGMPSAGEIRPGFPSGCLPCGFPHRLPSLSGCQFVKMSNVPRVNRVFTTGRAADGKYAILARWSRDNLTPGNGFCLTSARRWEASCARRSRACQLLEAPVFFLLFRRSTFPTSNRKASGEKHTRTPAFGRKFFGMKTKIRQHADNSAARCGEKKCSLRQAARAPAENER